MSKQPGHTAPLASWQRNGAHRFNTFSNAAAKMPPEQGSVEKCLSASFLATISHRRAAIVNMAPLRRINPLFCVRGAVSSHRIMPAGNLSMTHSAVFQNRNLNSLNLTQATLSCENLYKEHTIEKNNFYAVGSVHNHRHSPADCLQ